jgi:tellurite resistance protein TerC
MLDKLRYLHYGLAAILGFAALKMIAGRWVEVPATISLVVMGGILAACGVISASKAAREQGSEGAG